MPGKDPGGWIVTWFWASQAHSWVAGLVRRFGGARGLPASTSVASGLPFLAPSSCSESIDCLRGVHVPELLLPATTIALRDRNQCVAMNSIECSGTTDCLLGSNPNSGSR
jgi:hypothetical protein